MGITLPTKLACYTGQCITSVELSDDVLNIHCRRDMRYTMRGAKSGRKGYLNRWLNRTVEDLPVMGVRCRVHIRYAQLAVYSDSYEVERIPFVEAGARVTNRYARFISGLCRFMPVDAVRLYVGLPWQTVKNIDKAYMQRTLDIKRPCDLEGLEYIGVDEVAKAKGQSYVTIVYDLTTGGLLWSHDGRTSEVLEKFFDGLEENVANGIKAISMDMGKAYQLAVRNCLSHADIVFDRFHVMQMYNKALGQVRVAQFKKAEGLDKDLIKGSRFLLLSNQSNLEESERAKLAHLLAANEAINTSHVLKEQLQLLWVQSTSFGQMMAGLMTWCQLAEESALPQIIRVASSLRGHAVGICNYAKHQITNGIVEAKNVGIGMIRKRARGLQDVRYFILKIFQLNSPIDTGILINYHA